MANDAWIGADPPGVPSAEVWQKDGVPGGGVSIVVGAASDDSYAHGDFNVISTGPASSADDTFGSVTIPIAGPPSTGDAFYFTENVGLALVVDKGDVDYLTENVGLRLVATNEGNYYLTENVGLAFFKATPWAGWGVPVYSGLVDTDDWYYLTEDVTT